MNVTVVENTVVIHLEDTAAADEFVYWLKTEIRKREEGD